MHRFVNASRLQCRQLRPVSTLRPRCLSTSTVKVDDPYSGDIYCEVADTQNVAQKVQNAQDLFKTWQHSPVADRVAVCQGFLDYFANNRESIAMDISCQMGKPVAHARGEVNTMIDRAKAMMKLAPEALAEINVSEDEFHLKKIVYEPIGVSLCLAPWNYPLLCAVNTVITGVLSGCPILLKHAKRTPLCADHFADAFKAAGADPALVQAIHMQDHDDVAKLIKHPSVAYVNFTGSVEGGRSVYKSVSERFIDCGLELGGKDAAYMAADAKLSHAADIVDGALFNAGQSCCAIERVYVHDSLYEDFLELAQKEVNAHTLGNPRDASTTMGPMAQANAVDFLKSQVDEAKSKGARVLAGGNPTSHNGQGRFFEPTLVADCTHDMSIMTEESFGPVIAVQAVSSDEDAVKMMNDSDFGLTASVWTESKVRAFNLAKDISAGTLFMNRSDFLDPELAWSGRRDSGKGVGLSKLAFAAFHRTKSYNFKF